MLSAAEYVEEFISKTDKHIFLTGKAGTGKTTLLAAIKSRTFKSCIIVAPTGIAAINSGGVTIHSLFQLPIATFVPDTRYRAGEESRFSWHNPRTLISTIRLARSKIKLLRSLELLIVDEVSMLRADVLDMIDTVLRHVRGHREAFGGVQLLFIGDMFQLPPVVKDLEWATLKDYYKSIYFFDAQVLRESPPLYIELDKIYRQSDKKFISLLNKLRNNEIEYDDVELLNTYYNPKFTPAADLPYITLTTHNASADTMNQQELAKIPAVSKLYKAEVKGEFPEYMFPVEPILELKIGAQIMFIKNDLAQEKRFFNGKLGIISKLESDKVEVYIPTEDVRILVEKYEWKNIQYEFNERSQKIEEKELGTFRLFPLKLAWAITIHKSQGLTFDRAILDINSAFAPGQVYVALSRLRSLDGLVLLKPAQQLNLRLSPKIVEYCSSAAKSADLDLELERGFHPYLLKYALHKISFESLQRWSSAHWPTIRHGIKRTGDAEAMQICNDVEASISMIREVSTRFGQQMERLAIEHEQNVSEIFHKRVDAGFDFFTENLSNLWFALKSLLPLVEKSKDTKLILVEGLQATKEDSHAFYTLYLYLCGLQKVEGIKQNPLAQELIDSEPSTSKKKAAPGVSQQQSYTLFREGKSVADIAQQRGMAISTIHGHLSKYVKSGAILITEVVSADRLALMEDKAKALPPFNLKEFKAALPSSITYEDIRYYTQHLLYKSDKSNTQWTSH